MLDEGLHAGLVRQPSQVPVARQGQRLQPDHELSRHVERHAGRRQQPHRRRHLVQRDGEVPHRVDHVLAVVEHQQHGATGQHPGDRLRCRVPDEPQPQRGGDRLGHPAPVRDGREPHRDALGAGALAVLGRRLQREPRLADPSRARDREHRLGVQEPQQLRQVLVAADQRPCRRADRGRRAHPAGRQGTCGHEAFPGAEGRRRVQARLLGEPSPVRRGRVHRLRGPALHGVRPHEQDDRALPQRAGRDGGGGIGGPARPRGDRGLERVVAQAQAELVERDLLDRQARAVDELGERVATPEAQGVGGGIVGEPPGVRDVEPAVLELEHVAAIKVAQPVRVRTEVAPQPGHVALHRLRRVARRVVGPQLVDDRGAADLPALGHRQHREDGPPPAAGDVDRDAVDEEAQGAEELDTQSARHLVSSRPGPGGHCAGRCRREPAPSHRASAVPAAPAIVVHEAARSRRTTRGHPMTIDQQTENDQVLASAELDLDRVLAFAGQVAENHAIASNGVLTYLGDRLGLWRTLASVGPVTSAELAERTGLAERYLREWVARPGRRRLPHATTRPTSGSGCPPSTPPCWPTTTARRRSIGGVRDRPWPRAASADRLAHAFITGEGVGWHEHDDRAVQRGRAVLPAAVRGVAA